MIGGVSGIGGVYFNPYIQARQGVMARSAQARNTQAVLSARRPASPETPVEPVRPVKAVNPNGYNPIAQGLPLAVRQGADPVEMAVRMRIQYEEPLPGGQEADTLPGQGGEEEAVPAALFGQGTPAEAGLLPGEDGETAEVPGLGGETESVRETAEKGECQTCKNRKYQDGSDDPGVSFKTPTNVDPSQAANAVRGHEQEHVTREQAKAAREDRKVISQSVTYHTAICPECGRVYVSGGTTRTVTAANTDNQEEPREDGQESQEASVLA